MLLICPHLSELIFLFLGFGFLHSLLKDGILMVHLKLLVHWWHASEDFLSPVVEPLLTVRLWNSILLVEIVRNTFTLRLAKLLCLHSVEDFAFMLSKAVSYLLVVE